MGVFKGAEFRPSCFAHTTPSLHSDLIFVKDKLKSADSCRFKFWKQHLPRIGKV